MATLRDVAKAVGMDVHFVREILKENEQLKATKSDQDRVFNAARRLGYDLKRLRIAKRMHWRKQTIQELIENIEKNGSWDRGEILKYMRHSIDFVDRVHKKAFTEEFGG